MRSSSTLNAMERQSKARSAAVVASGKAGIAFGERFVAGTIPAFGCLLEDSAALRNLQSGDPSRHAQLMNITLCYSNSLCDAMAIALFDNVPDVSLVKVVDPAGITLHTCVSNKRPGAAGKPGDCLNVNGVISSSDLIGQWELITGHRGVRIVPATFSEVIGTGRFDERDSLRAMELFGVASRFMDDNLDSLVAKTKPGFVVDLFAGSRP